MQEIFVRIWRGIPNLKDETKIDTWCYRVALNTAISWNRKSKRRPISKALVEEPLQDQGYQSEISLVRQFLATLNEIDQVILLMYLDDFSYQSIAEVIGMKEGTIRVRLHRIKTKLESWEAD